MKFSTLTRRLVALSFLAAPLAGCDSSGTTPDTTPTAPPITAKSGDELTKEINPQKGTMKPTEGTAPKANK